MHENKKFYNECIHIKGFIEKSTHPKREFPVKLIQYVTESKRGVSFADKKVSRCPICSYAGGGFTAGKDKYYSSINTTACTESDLGILASAFMWMKAYEIEEMVLKYMFENRIKMSSKLQERLHSLSNRKGDAPEEINVSGSDGLSFDISSLNWDDDSYEAFFKNLEFKEKTLNYPLAIREEDQVLSLNKVLAADSKMYASLYNIIKKDMTEEYGNTVQSDIISLRGISGGSNLQMDGVLVRPNDCRYMGIFLYLIPIGKKLNIKFYTLYIPERTSAENQLKQAINLSKKLNPNVAMWETSIKGTLLLSIQKMLNSGIADTNMAESVKDNSSFVGNNGIDEGDVEF